MMRVFAAMLRRDLRLAVRRRGDVLNTLVFFIMATLLFPLGIGAERPLLLAVAPGVLWVAALLAALLSLPRLFDSDYADGSLEQMLLAQESPGLLVLAKILAHWLSTGFLLALLAPLAALPFGLDAGLVGVLSLSLALGTPLLSLIGAIAAALTLGLRGAGVLSALLVIPLFVPVLIFGAGAVNAAQSGLGASSHLLLLAGMLMLALPLAPWAAAAALRIAVDAA